jgi:sporadic carbohydrate cluster protein (TIGR04323 family)
MVRKPYLGYNFCGAIQDRLYPQRLQNLCIRDYCHGKAITLSFSVSEYIDSTQSLMLFTQFEIAEKIQGIVFFSLLMLPKVPARRRQFYELVKQHGLEVHFALEDIALMSPNDQGWVERLYTISVDTRLDENRRAVVNLVKTKRLTAG